MNQRLSVGERKLQWSHLRSCWRTQQSTSHAFMANWSTVTRSRCSGRTRTHWHCPSVMRPSRWRTGTAAMWPVSSVSADCHSPSPPSFSVTFSSPRWLLTSHSPSSSVHYFSHYAPSFLRFLLLPLSVFHYFRFQLLLTLLFVISSLYLSHLWCCPLPFRRSLGSASSLPAQCSPSGSQSLSFSM